MGKKANSASVVRSMEPSYNSIKIFSYKGAFTLAIICVLATTLVPYLLRLIGIDEKIALVSSASILGSFGLCFVRNFIESKKGFTKSFFIQFVLFGIAFFVITYYWTYYNYFI